MYYVYELVDPRDHIPFYVGKGTGRRCHRHVAEAKMGRHGKKCDRIREILSAGLSVETVIVREFDDESRAYAFERHRIAKLGLVNLTNLAPGGGSVRRISEALPVPIEQVIALFCRIVANPAPKHGIWSAALYRAVVMALPRLIENRA